MIVSRNEIESLALKAARGAGMSWGLAEEASVAAGWLAAHALPWADTLAGVLIQAHATSPPRIAGQVLVPSCPGTRLCPIMAGAFLADLGPPDSALEVHDLLAPLWLAPFLASWGGRDHGVRLSWVDAHLVVSPSALAGTGATPALTAAFSDRVAIALEPIGRSAQTRPGHGPRGYVAPDDAWHTLQALEQRTYVPASAQSRLAGAGAGLLDND